MRQVLDGRTGFYQPITLIEEVQSEVIITEQVVMIKESKPSKMDEIIFNKIKELVLKPTLTVFEKEALQQLQSQSKLNRL